MGKTFRHFVTDPELVKASQPVSPLRSVLGLGVLILAGYAGNYFNLSLFFGVDFLFGGIAVLLVVCLYGIVWGTIAAAIAGSYTFFLWGHPYAAIVLTLEALFVGWWLRRKRQNLLLLNGFYWVFIGIPLVWLFYSQVIIGVPDQTVLLIVVKHSVNGIFNALIASLLLTHSPIHKWVARPKVAKTLSLQQTLFNLLVAFVLFPALTLVVLHSRSALNNIETTIQTTLQYQSTDVVVGLHSWQKQSRNALKQLAEVAARADMAPSLALQQSTELLQRTFPDFHQLFVANETGKAIASYPATYKTIADSTDLKPLDHKELLILSDVSLAGDYASFPMLIQSVPVTRNNRFVGSVISESDLSVVNQLLKSFIHKQEVEITLLDRQERVIASTRPNLQTLQAFDHRQGGEIRPINTTVYQWLPVDQKKPIMIRWKESFYVQKTPASDNLPWTVIVEAPTKPHFRYLENIYIKSLAIVLLLAVLALILASIISQWIAKPLRRLAIVTTDVPDKLLDQKAIAWPSSWVTEINALVDNFKYVAGTLEQKFQEIKSAKEQLEQRVQERTQELSAANRELKAEVAERKRVAESLQRSEALLRAQAQKLEKALHELQRTQAHLVQTEKMSSLGQMVAGVAHEINNPVNFIYGNLIHAKDYTQELLRLVQVYQQQYPNPTRVIQEEIETIELEFLREDLPKLLNSMQVGAERIQEIVKSLRNFSRLDESEMKEVDIHEGIDSTLMILKNRLKVPLLGQGGEQLEIVVIKEYGDLPLVECYPGELNQVFMNILVNAIDAIASRLLAGAASAIANANDALEELNVKRLKVVRDRELLATLGASAFPEGVGSQELKVEGLEDNIQSANLQPATPWIQIRTEVVEEDWVAIRIADNGIGITEELSSKMFDPFFTTKLVGQGTGLGLSISYQIVVERHGGKLECISKPEQGAEFIIKIPRRQSGLIQRLNPVKSC